MYRIQKQMWLVIVALAVLVTVFAPAAEAGCRKVAAQMNEPFMVGEQVFSGGELSLCAVRDFSPVSTLNEIRVNGQSLGMLMARDGHDTTPSKSDQIIFERDARGQLVLVSVALTGEPLRSLYTLTSRHDGWHRLTADKRQDLLVASVK